MDEVWAAIGGAAVGGLLAFAAAEWAFRRARRLSKAEVARQELDVLDGLNLEIGVAIEIAERASATPLPMAYLHDAMPLRRDMNQPQVIALRDYATAVQRYNGRVQRIVAYGMGKRAAGQSPGAEKPESHAKEVLAAATVAVDRLNELTTRKRPQRN